MKVGDRRIEIYGGPNKHGDYHFALFWVAGYHPGHPLGENRIAERGQHFLDSLKRFDDVPQTDLRGE